MVAGAKELKAPRMNDFEYHLGGGLTPEHLDCLHAEALRVLDEIGVEVQNEKLRGHAGAQAGVRVTGTRVRLAPELVDRLVAEHRADRKKLAQPEPDRPFRIEILSGYSFEWIDPTTGLRRPMLTSDCIRMAAMVDGLYNEGVRGGTPGLPQDVPAACREVLSYKISLEHTRVPGWPGFTSRANGEAVLEMAKVVSRRIGLSVFVRDPLLVEGPTVDMAVEYWERGEPISLALSSMPMPGATCPLPLPAAYVEAIATNLGAFVLFRLLGTDIGICPTVFPFDMRAGAIAMGTPEHAIGWFMADQICRYYNVAGFDFCPAFQTNAVAADAHSMTTRTAFATAGALYGVRGFGYGGQLGIDKIFSAEQLILDTEIIRYLRHLVAPISFSSATEAVDMLREVGPGGDFLTHPSTLAACRSQWSSTLFRNESPEQAAVRAPDAGRDAMREMIRRAEAAHDYRLEPGRVRELNRIYQHYAAGVAT